MSFCFGLYFGDTNLCLAANRNGTSEVIANSAGDRNTPAYVAFSDDEKLVGLAAKQGSVRNASNTITRIKSLLFGDRAIIDEIIRESQCPITEEGGLKYSVIVDDRPKDFSPFEALVSLFKNMANISKSYCHSDDIPAVITVPLDSSAKQKEIINLAATDAGFDVLRIISEPSAAALAYDIGQESNQDTFHCLVFRLGGYSLDVTVIRVVCGIYHVLASTRENFGGKVFTQHLMDFCASEFYRKYKLDVKENRRSVAKLQASCETCKHVLSTLGSSRCFAESLYQGVDLNIDVSQARFESLIANSLQKCLEPIIDVLQKAQLSKEDIKEVILAGGSCKIPKLQQLIADFFLDIKCLSSIPPDEATAIGAAKEASIISQSSECSSEKDCFINTLGSSISLEIQKTDGKLSLPLLPKHTPVPAFKEMSFEIDGTAKTEIAIVQGRSNADIGSGEIEGGSLLLAKLVMPMTSAKELTISSWVSCEQTVKVVCKDKALDVKRSLMIKTKN